MAMRFAHLVSHATDAYNTKFVGESLDSGNTPDPNREREPLQTSDKEGSNIARVRSPSSSFETSGSNNDSESTKYTEPPVPSPLVIPSSPLLNEPDGDQHSMWTEIRKDLVTEEAMRYMGYMYRTTEDFDYVMEFLSNFLFLVNLSDRLRIYPLLDKTDDEQTDPSTMFTEITKDLITEEAIRQMVYVYETTEYFFYLLEYLSYLQGPPHLYVGKDKKGKRTVIHAPHTGTVVKKAPVWTSELCGSAVRFW
ncbi:hypothetical protein QBC43DRAFT_294727 [Cladorrhinum sp. PSN259]|nr:hypothetical protein QBC43DRAFT_294727 [Cladorrhinum sp. PSN259]